MDKKSFKTPKVRRKWIRNPKTQVKENTKTDKRQKQKKELQKLISEVENGKGA